MVGSSCLELWGILRIYARLGVTETEEVCVCGLGSSVISLQLVRLCFACACHGNHSCNGTQMSRQYSYGWSVYLNVRRQICLLLGDCVCRCACMFMWVYLYLCVVHFPLILFRDKHRCSLMISRESTVFTTITTPNLCMKIAEKHP